MGSKSGTGDDEDSDDAGAVGGPASIGDTFKTLTARRVGHERRVRVGVTLFVLAATAALVMFLIWLANSEVVRSPFSE